MTGCAACGRGLVQRADEPSGNFRKRQTCDHACQEVLRDVLRAETRRRAVAKLPVRDCLHCGKRLVPHDDEPLGNFKQRATCDLKCGYARAGQLRSTPTPVDPRCLVCNAEIVRRPHEAAKPFAKRKTCSATCQYAAAGKAKTRRTDQNTKKSCEACGAWFGPGQLSTKNFALQRTCSSKCSGLLRRTPGTDAARSCAVCEEILVRRPTEPWAAFVKRLACGARCRQVHARAVKVGALPARACAVCAKPILIRPGEQLQQFTHRQTCASKECMSLNRQQHVNYHGVVLPIKVVFELEGGDPETTRARIKAGKIPGVFFVAR